MKTICSGCERQQTTNGTWISKDAVYSPRFPQGKQTTHGICSPCLAKALKELEEMVIVK